MQLVEEFSLMVPPFPVGQVVNDYLARLRHSHAGRNLEIVYKALLDRAPSLDSMPNGLRDFHQAVGYLYDDLEGIARHHLAIEYYCCGLPPEKYEQQFARVFDILPGPVRLTRLPVLFSASEREYLTCPECKEVQIRVEGFSYVHRRTGAPFVDTCCLHGCDLTPANGQMFLFDQGCRGHRSSYQRMMAIEFATRVSNSMEVPAALSPYNKRSVVDLLHRSGWIDRGGRVQLSSLLSEFVNFFAGAFSDLRLQFLAQTDSLVDNALRNLVRDTRAVHPVWCVLFAWFAGSCEIRVARRQKSRLQPRPDPSAEELRITLREQGTIAKAAGALALSEIRVTSLCKRFGIEVSWRPKFVDASLQKAIGDALNRGDSPKSVQAKYRVSLSTVYRILASRSDTVLPRQKEKASRTAADKIRWRSTSSQHPTLSLTELRALMPTVWFRLHRNAPDWLADNARPRRKRKFSPKQSISAHALLDILSESIGDAESTCAGGERAPLRKSLYRVRRVLGVSEYAFERGRQHLLMSKKGETTLAFVERRVRWALSQVGRRGKNNWAVAKKARLRQETVSRVLGSKV